MKSMGSLLLLVAALSSAASCSYVRGNPKHFSEYNSQLLKQVTDDIGLTTDKTNPSITKQTLMEKFIACAKKYPKEIDKNNNTSALNQYAGIACRNELIGKLMLFIDLQYNEFRTSLYMDTVNYGFGADLVTIGLSTASALTTVEAPKTTLALLTAGIAGTRSSFDKSYLFDKTMPALIDQMDNDRDTIRKRIMSNWNNDVDIYPISQAIYDINAYFYAGTLPSAIKSLVSLASKQTTKDNSAENIKLESTKNALKTTTLSFNLSCKKKFITDALNKKIINYNPNVLKTQYSGFDPDSIDATTTDINANLVIDFIFKSTTDQPTCEALGKLIDTLSKSAECKN